MPPPPTLPEELLEEVFLRLPPDEPACLVRASLASKLWLALLTGPAFHGRYCDFHGAPPMLGFLYTCRPDPDHAEAAAIPHFVSTTKFAPHIPDWRPREHGATLDCRHGRVLLADTPLGPSELAVWDPMTGWRRELDEPAQFIGVGAAVLCAVTGCDHRACHRGPFQVLLFGRSMDDGEIGFAHARVYSSETNEWSQPCSRLHLGSEDAAIVPMPSVLFENALYHIIGYPDHAAILMYDMGSNCMSLLDVPPIVGAITEFPILMTLEDASLGFAYLDGLTLYLLSRLVRSDGVAAWTQRRVVDLKELLLIQDPNKCLTLIGFKKDSDTIFITMDLDIYEINLKSLEWKKLWKRAKVRALIPYMSFYNPPEKATTSSKTVH